MDKLISVIVPVYNVEKYLCKCIDSILAQSYTNLEIILVDDGSPDNSPAICDEYANKDSRIKVIHLENGGLSAARNAGLDIASGDFIGFIDSDDYISPEMYKKLYEAMKAADADISICNFQKVDEAGKNIKTEETIESGTLSSLQALTGLQGKNGVCFVYSWNKLFNRQIFDELRFPIGRYCEDNYIAHILLNRARAIVCLNECMYFYTQRKGSIMNNTTSLKLAIDEIDGFIERYNYFLNSGFSSLIRDCKKFVITSYRMRYCLLSKPNRVIFKNQFERTYNSYYLELRHNKSLKDFFFKHQRAIYCLLFQIKHHFFEFD